MDNDVKGTGNHSSFGDYGYDPRVGRRWMLEPMIAKYPSLSPYVAYADNPVLFKDPDGLDIYETTKFISNNSMNNFYKLVSQNSVYQKVMKQFITNQADIWIHIDQLKDEQGNPTGYGNIARTESAYAKSNPVSKYGLQRIIINSDILNSSGEIGIDKTVLFMAFLHEGDHARMFQRLFEDKFKHYPGHKDFVINRPGDGSHHNQMAAFNRSMLVLGMKEFDNQLKEVGETVPEYHTEDWYQAMAWYGLRGSNDNPTKAWQDFQIQEPEKALLYDKIIKEQDSRNKESINSQSNE
jgi:hypothetical protein